MIKLIIGTTTDRDTVLVPPSTTLKKALADNRVAVQNNVTITLDGTPLIPSQLDKTFEDFDITDSCMLIATINSKNA